MKFYTIIPNLQRLHLYKNILQTKQIPTSWNQQLSYLKAAEVMKYLKQQGVINHISIERKEATLFIADNNSLIGKEQNRRVEFEFL